MNLWQTNYKKIGYTLGLLSLVLVFFIIIGDTKKADAATIIGQYLGTGDYNNSNSGAWILPSSTIYSNQTANSSTNPIYIRLLLNNTGGALPSDFTLNGYLFDVSSTQTFAAKYYDENGNLLSPGTTVASIPNQQLYILLPDGASFSNTSSITMNWDLTGSWSQIAGYFDSTIGDVPNFTLYQGAPFVNTPVLNVIYPNSSDTIPFDNFILQGTGLNASDTYDITYGVFIPSINGETTYGIYNYTGYSALQLQSGLAVPNNIIVPSTATEHYDIHFELIDENLVNSTTTGGIIANTYLTNLGIYGNNIYNPSSTYVQIQVTTPGTAISTPIISTSSTLPWQAGYSTAPGSPQPPAGATQLITCPAPAGITDIGGGIYWAGCQILNLAFNPNIAFNSTEYFGDQISALEKVPPFSAFFTVANTIQNGAKNFGNTTSSINTVSIGILGYGANNTPVQTDLVDINSTTFNNGFGTSEHSSMPTSNAVNFMETFIAAWLWIAAGIKILYVFTQKT